MEQVRIAQLSPPDAAGTIKQDFDQGVVTVMIPVDTKQLDTRWEAAGKTKPPSSTRDRDWRNAVLTAALQSLSNAARRINLTDALCDAEIAKVQALKETKLQDDVP